MALNGDVTTCTANSVTVGSSSTTLLAANANRKYACFSNTSDELVYIQLGGTAVQGKGIMLGIEGEANDRYEITIDKLYKGIVTAICSSGSKVVATEECT